LPSGESFGIKRSRRTEQKSICQYVTNGLEILDKTPWLGKWIPIIPVFGKEIWVDRGDGSKRELISMVRLARDPFMLYCYYRTCQAEVVGMTPKTPFIGYEGQFDTNTDWANIHKLPVAYAEVKAMMDATGSAVLPIPQRQMFEPPIQALELGAEAARRAIQAAMGISPLPTQAQRQNEKSGVALQRIESSQQKGSFHFVDNFKMAMENSGRQMNFLIKKIMDTSRDVGMRNDDETYEVRRINDPEHQNNIDLGEDDDHDLTITTGPKYDTQRQEAADYIEALVGTPLFPLVADLATKLKNLGPLGDQIAERLVPPQFASKGEDGKPLPPEAMAKIQELTQQLQVRDQAGSEMSRELQKYEAGFQVKQLEAQNKMELAKLAARTKIIEAMIAAKSKADATLAVAEAEHELAQLDASHDAMMKGLEHAHEHDVIDHQAAATPPAEDKPKEFVISRLTGVA
jgi:hypothetical protein